MAKSPRKNVPDVGIELGAACMPSEHASDRATAARSGYIGDGIKSSVSGQYSRNLTIYSSVFTDLHKYLIYRLLSFNRKTLNIRFGNLPHI